MSSVVFQIKYKSKIPPVNMPEEMKAEYAAARKFYDCTADFNNMRYIADKEKIETNKDFEHYASRQGNLGLFNGEKVYSQEEVDKIRRELQTTKSHIWHGFISFDEETSKQFQVQEQAMRFIKQHFNDFINRTHLDKNNICILAALHKDTEHRHIHFTFFEKVPQHLDKNGNLGFSTKGNFKQAVIDNWLISANMAVNKDDLYIDRNAVITKLREMKASAAAEFTDQEMKIKLLSLASKFPKNGSLRYADENMNALRPEIDKLANFILCSSPEIKELHQKFLRDLAARDKRVHKIKADNKIASKIYYTGALEKDYKTRVGNMVIALAKEMKRQYRPPYHKETSAAKRMQKRFVREHGQRVYSKFNKNLMFTLSQVQKNMQAEFLGTVKDAERGLHDEMIMEELRGSV